MFLEGSSFKLENAKCKYQTEVGQDLGFLTENSLEDPDAFELEEEIVYVSHYINQVEKFEEELKKKPIRKISSNSTKSMASNVDSNVTNHDWELSEGFSLFTKNNQEKFPGVLNPFQTNLTLKDKEGYYFINAPKEQIKNMKNDRKKKFSLPLILMHKKSNEKSEDQREMEQTIIEEFHRSKTQDSASKKKRFAINFENYKDEYSTDNQNEDNTMYNTVDMESVTTYDSFALSKADRDSLLVSNRKFSEQNKQSDDFVNKEP